MPAAALGEVQHVPKVCRVDFCQVKIVLLEGLLSNDPGRHLGIRFCLILLILGGIGFGILPRGEPVERDP
jgi:hypothetical protein